MEVDVMVGETGGGGGGERRSKERTIRGEAVLTRGTKIPLSPLF